MSMECIKVKSESLTNKNYKKADEEALDLVYDRDFLESMQDFFGVGQGTSFFLTSKEEILKDESLFPYFDFRNKILKFGDTFGYEETYDLWY